MSYKSHLLILISVKVRVSFKVCLSGITGQDCAQNSTDWRRQGCEAKYVFQLLDLPLFQSLCRFRASCYPEDHTYG